MEIEASGKTLFAHTHTLRWRYLVCAMLRFRFEWELARMPGKTDPRALMSDPAVRALLEAGGVWLWDADLVTETTAYQPGFWEQYGHRPAEEAETFDFLRFVHRSDLREVTSAWRAHLDGETDLYQAEWRLRTASGEWRWIQSRGQVI